MLHAKVNTDSSDVVVVPRLVYRHDTHNLGSHYIQLLSVFTRAGVPVL